MLQLLLFLLPLGIDTLGISISLGIKSHATLTVEKERRNLTLPSWLRSAMLFSLAETTMPLIGLVLGYAVSLFISNVMHYVGPLLLICLGLWELLEELRERLKKREVASKTLPNVASRVEQEKKQSGWRHQLLLALSISLDELAIGFSLGSVTMGKSLSPITLCILIGIQSFLTTFIGITLGRSLRLRLQPVKEWSELLSGLLLIALGIWLLVT
ncbi:MAG: hypothetical protein NVS4B7_04870 [Ktedonobacteraceae bacterium]